MPEIKNHTNRQYFSTFRTHRHTNGTFSGYCVCRLDVLIVFLYVFFIFLHVSTSLRYLDHNLWIRTQKTDKARKNSLS